MDGCGGRRASAGLWPEVEGESDMRAPHVSARRREGRTGSERGARVGRGPFWLLGRNGTPGPFLIFFHFSFSFSFLFENFGFLKCIDLNNFKSAKICKIGQRVFVLN
jgi:hypothetical protein